MVAPLRISEAQLQRLFPGSWRLILSQSKPRSKFGNEICVDSRGKKCHSLTERNFIEECYLAEKAGVIKEVETQKPFLISEKPKRHYIADVVFYVEKEWTVASTRGKTVTFVAGRNYVVDVKSRGTKGLAVFRLKKALMMDKHGIDVIPLVRPSPKKQRGPATRRVKMSNRRRK